jgi:hypothetical protein
MSVFSYPPYYGKGKPVCARLEGTKLLTKKSREHRNHAMHHVDAGRTIPGDLTSLKTMKIDVLVRQIP